MGAALTIGPRQRTKPLTWRWEDYCARISLLPENYRRESDGRDDDSRPRPDGPSVGSKVSARTNRQTANCLMARRGRPIGCGGSCSPRHPTTPPHLYSLQWGDPEPCRRRLRPEVRRPRTDNSDCPPGALSTVTIVTVETYFWIHSLISLWFSNSVVRP
jgi:hypothetical protein